MPRTWSCLIDLYAVAEELREAGEDALYADHFEFLAMDYIVGIHTVIGARRHMMYSCPVGKHGPILEALKEQVPDLYPYLMKHTKAALVGGK